MTSRHIRAFCELSADCERLLERAMTQQGLSARAHDRILKVARTIADLEDAANLQPKHIAEAIQYRRLDRTLLGVRQPRTKYCLNQPGKQAEDQSAHHSHHSD